MNSILSVNQATLSRKFCEQPVVTNLRRQRKSQTVSDQSRKFAFALRKVRALSAQFEALPGVILSTPSIKLLQSKIQTASGKFRRRRLRNLESIATAPHGSGLLRFADLTMIAPNTIYPMFIVAPGERRQRVREQLARPSFRHLGIHEKARYLSYERVNEIEEFFGDKTGLNVDVFVAKNRFLPFCRASDSSLRCVSSCASKCARSSGS